MSRNYFNSIKFLYLEIFFFCVFIQFLAGYIYDSGFIEKRTNEFFSNFIFITYYIFSFLYFLNSSEKYNLKRCYSFLKYSFYISIFMFIVLGCPVTLFSYLGTIYHRMYWNGFDDLIEVLNGEIFFQTMKMLISGEMNLWNEPV